MNFFILLTLTTLSFGAKAFTLEGTLDQGVKIQTLTFDTRTTKQSFLCGKYIYTSAPLPQRHWAAKKCSN